MIRVPTLITALERGRIPRTPRQTNWWRMDWMQLQFDFFFGSNSLKLNVQLFVFHNFHLIDLLIVFIFFSTHFFPSTMYENNLKILQLFQHNVLCVLLHFIQIHHEICSLIIRLSHISLKWIVEYFCCPFPTHSRIKLIKLLWYTLKNWIETTAATLIPSLTTIGITRSAKKIGLASPQIMCVQYARNQNNKNCTHISSSTNHSVASTANK